MTEISFQTERSYLLLSEVVCFFVVVKMNSSVISEGEITGGFL